MSLQSPSHEEVFQKLTSLIADKIDVDKSSIHFDSTLSELGFDSLDTFNLISAAEDYFKIKVPRGKTDIITVSDVTALVHELTMNKDIIDNTLLNMDEALIMRRLPVIKQLIKHLKRVH